MAVEVTILQEQSLELVSTFAGSKHGGVTWLREYWLSSSLCRPGTHYSLKHAGSRFKCKRITKNLE